MKGVLILLVAIAIPLLALAQWRPPAAPPVDAGPALTSADILAVVADAGTLARADKDLYANTFVASSRAPDGGPGVYGFMCSQSPCTWKFGPGTQEEVTASANTLAFNVSEITMATVRIQQPANPAGTTVRWFADVGSWFGVLPSSDVSGCAAGTEGGIKANSTDHTLRYCNGTSPLTVATVVSASAALDFGTILTGASSTATMTVSGAVSGDAVQCNPTVALSSGVSVAYSYVSSADTVTVTENFIGAVSIDPASANFKCSIVR